MRIYGLRYCGASTGTAVAACIRTIARQQAAAAAYTIASWRHAGVEGQMDDKAGGLAFRQWATLRDQTDYVALGHFTKPFVLDEWICNPGGPGSCSINESDWTPRLSGRGSGYRAAAGAGRHRILGGNTPRRAMRHRLSHRHAPSPATLMSQLDEFLERKAQELGTRVETPGVTESTPPVVGWHLTGVLPFERRSLDLKTIEALIAALLPAGGRRQRARCRAPTMPSESDAYVARGELERVACWRPFRT